MTIRFGMRFTVLAAAAATLAACIPNPEDYETAPVQVTTDRGIVTCQLYTRERVIWDRSIHRPETMSVEAADDVCVSEGKRLAGLP